jgi:hypothetical protein
MRYSKKWHYLPQVQQRLHNKTAENMDKESINRANRIGRIFVNNYPAMAQIIENQLVKARIKDLDVLPYIFFRFCQINKTQPKNVQRGSKAIDRVLFVAVSLRLYQPDTLYLGLSLNKSGLQTKLSEILDLSPARLSLLMNNAQNYTAVYKDFSSQVNYIANKILEDDQIMESLNED